MTEEVRDPDRSRDRCPVQCHRESADGEAKLVASVGTKRAPRLTCPFGDPRHWLEASILIRAKAAKLPFGYFSR